MEDDRYKYSGLFDNNKIEIRAGDRVDVRLPTGQRVLGTVRFIDGCFDIVFDAVWVDIERIRRRDYLKCYTANHAVTIVHEDISPAGQHKGDK